MDLPSGDVKTAIEAMAQSKESGFPLKIVIFHGYVKVYQRVDAFSDRAHRILLKTCWVPEILMPCRASGPMRFI